MLNPNQIGPSAVPLKERGEGETKREKTRLGLILLSNSEICFHPCFIYYNRLVEVSLILLISFTVLCLELEAKKGSGDETTNLRNLRE